MYLALLFILPIIAVCRQWNYGYTISNLFWISPVLYFSRALVNQRLIGKGLRTLLLLPMTGFLLDILFAGRFFIFPNKASTVGVNVPGYSFESHSFDEPIPIEEFIFYIAGFAYTLYSYIYFTKILPFSPLKISSWLRFPSQLQRIGALLCLLIGSSLLRWSLRGTLGIPEYLWFIILFGIGPVIWTSNKVSGKIHLGAFLLTLCSVLVISITWEVTLAIPQGWWGYKSDPMIGLFIDPWSHLPVESVLVWFCVSFTTVFTHEYLNLE